MSVGVGLISCQSIAIKFGEDGTTTLNDPLGRYPDHGFYCVVEYRRDAPVDTDGDGFDDVQELLAPLDCIH